MRIWVGFLIGVAVGAAIGIGSMPGSRDRAGPPPNGTNEVDHSACRTLAESLRAENEILRAQVDAAPPAAVAGATAPTAAPVADAENPAATAEENAMADFKIALEKVRGQLRSVGDKDAGSAAVLALLAEYRKLLKDENEMLADLGGRALVYLAGAGKLRPEDVDAMALEFATLRPGTPGRAGMAATVARAHARGPRLAQWFARLPATKEPKVRAAVVEALDESPSDAYREYLLKLSRSERDHDVLAATWHEDPITVAMTAEWAPLLIAAIEPRVAEGDLPPAVRGRALFAIGLASVHEAEGSSAAIGRLLATETDEGVLAYGRDVIASIGREEANVQTLDALWAKHRGSFGEK